MSAILTGHLQSFAHVMHSDTEQAHFPQGSNWNRKQTVVKPLLLGFQNQLGPGKRTYHGRSQAKRQRRLVDILQFSCGSLWIMYPCENAPSSPLFKMGL